MLCRTHLDHGIEKPRRADKLLDDDPLTLSQFILGRRSTDIEDARGESIELLVLQRAVIQCCGQAKSVLHKTNLSRAVTSVHSMDLRDGHMALIYDQQIVTREVVQQAEGTLTGLPTIEVAGVVLDPRAIAELTYHL